MKKLFLTLLAILTSYSAYALPLGNPADASLLTDGVFCPANSYNEYTSILYAWAIKGGFYSNYVFDRKLQVDREEDDSNIRSTQLRTHAGYLAINFWDRIDIFGTLGATNIEIKTPRSSFIGSAGPNRVSTILTESDFSYSVGARATFWMCRGFMIGAEGQYFYTRPEITSVENSQADAPVYLNDERLRFQEWQIGLGIAYRVNIVCCSTAVVPYMGVTLSRAIVDMDNLIVDDTMDTNEYYDLESAQNWGYAFGLSLIGCGKWGATVEWRFIDESSFSFNTQFRY